MQENAPTGIWNFPKFSEDPRTPQKGKGRERRDYGRNRRREEGHITGRKEGKARGWGVKCMERID